jgi:deferrochelatase/peroxidase EfeB
MTAKSERAPCPTRRGFLATTAGLVATAGSAIGGAATAIPAQAKDPSDAARPGKHQIEPFWGKHQSGIVTPAQAHTYFASFDLETSKREELVAMLRRWTPAAARMSLGQPADSLEQEAQSPAADPGDTAGLSPSRLTLTFGFGAGLFDKDGKDRYGLAAQRPDALVDMPIFAGDQLVASRTGGDLSVQACADDPQVAFHAVRQLARLAYDVAQIRWVQTGFVADFGAKTTPRNLMGFKDGTGNILVTDAKALDQFVWVGHEGPAWMQSGSYVAVRRSRIALEHWDRMNVSFQEQTFGRYKLSGAPLGKKSEFDPLDLDLADHDGNPVIPDNSHVRLANHASNDGARILRRSYSYNDGVNLVAERWPPWHQGMEYDAGLLFVCYQRDPRSGFIRIFERMSKFDMMNQFVTNMGSGLFACPRGAAKGEFIGQQLFEA